MHYYTKLVRKQAHPTLYETFRMSPLISKRTICLMYEEGGGVGGAYVCLTATVMQSSVTLTDLAKCQQNKPLTINYKAVHRRVTNIRITAHFTRLLKFRNFVFATEVTIFSDYNPLMYSRECAPKSAKLTRWALGLQEFMHADSNIFHTSV